MNLPEAIDEVTQFRARLEVLRMSPDERQQLVNRSLGALLRLRRYNTWRKISRETGLSERDSRLILSLREFLP